MGLLQDILDSQFRDAHEKAKRKQNGAEEPSLLGALKDPQFRQDVKRGLLDSLNRGAVASTIGGPVDLATLALRPLGYNVEKPVLGSEWVGDKMQQLGLLGDTRNPIAEAIASVAVPGAMTKAGQGLFKAEQAAIKNAQIAGPLSDSRLASQRGVFGGLNAKTADKAKLAQAEQMLNKGVDPAQVWKETGWGRGPDGKWRFEISDDAAKFNKSASGENALTHGMEGVDLGPTVGGLLDHPELKNAYGGVTNSTRIGNKNTLFGDGVQGSYSDGTLTLNAPASAADAKSTTLHELQHAIQQREGFARGGSPGSNGLSYDDLTASARKAYEGSRNTYNDPLLAELYAGEKPLKPWDEMNNIERIPYYEQAQMGAYERLGGEAEARLVQSRMNLTPEQRLSQYPWDADYFKQQTGVGLDDLIHRFDGGEAKSVGFTYPQDAVLETARQNGVKMLGLPENNTPMDRLKALQQRGLYNENLFHETSGEKFGDAVSFNPRMATAAASDHETPYAVFLKNNGNYIGVGGQSEMQMPLVATTGNKFEFRDRGALNDYLMYPENTRDAVYAAKRYDDHQAVKFDALEKELQDKAEALGVRRINDGQLDDFLQNWEAGNKELASKAKEQITNHFNGLGVDSVQLHNDAGSFGRKVNTTMVLNPANIRSRFAAFDPARVNENDLLAGAMPFGLLLDPENRAKLGMQ